MWFKKRRVENGYGETGYVFGENIFSFHIIPNGNIVISEECDGAFSRELPISDAIAVFEEAASILKGMIPQKDK